MTPAEIEYAEPGGEVVPDRVIAPGEVLTLSAGSVTHVGDLTISQGGRLEIEGPQKEWTEIYVSGDLTMRGVIRMEGFRRRAGADTETVTRSAQDGRDLSFTYEHGRGGAGGHGADGHPNRGGRGGEGAQGGTDFGGGGGGGAGLEFNGPGTDGSAGDDRIGGTGGRAYCDRRRCGGVGGRGGEGGLSHDLSDGGLLYLSVRKELDGEGGEVVARGSAGSPGGAAAPGQASRGGQGGGGGGGGAGGHGGCLIISATRRRIRALPAISLSGGSPGEFGAGASGWRGRGEDGEPGQAGRGGLHRIERYRRP